MSRTWFKAIAVSAVASIVFALVGTIAFGGGVSYSNVDWQRADAMTYREAQKYIAENSKAISGWEALLQNSTHPGYWQMLFYGWLASFVFGMFCCGTLVWWLGYGKAPSNPTPHADARDVPASASDSGARAGERER